jgi:ABC-type amino acid transport substrate-binding protein
VRKIFVALLIIIALALPAVAQDKKPSAYDRVIVSGTIHCGYFLWPPFIEKNVNTGKLSGLSYDLMEEIGKQLSLKID